MGQGERPPKGWRKIFFQSLSNTGNVRASCAKALISSQTVYKLYHANEKFKAQWDEAMENACDLLEYEARVRAMGQRQPTEGAIPPSDTLMIFLLKAHRPQVFDKQHVVSTLLQQIADNTAPRPNGGRGSKGNRSGDS